MISLKNNNIAASAKLRFALTIVLFLCFNVRFGWASQPLTWQECLLEASEFHPDLISASQQIRQSKDSSLIAQSALWPQAQANLGFSQTKAMSTSTNYAYGLSGSQLIFDASKTIDGIRSSKENVKSSAENFRYVSSLVRLRLRTSFINLLKAQKLIGLTKEIYDIRKQNLDLITLRYNSGTEHRGALLTAEANLAQALFEIHQAQRGLRVAQRNLIKEMGSKILRPIEVKGEFDISSHYEQSPDFEQLALNNPQLLKLVAQKNAASFNAKVDQDDFWPSVSLNGGVGKSDRQWPPKTTSTDVGLQLTWSFLEGGAKRARLDQSKSKVLDLQAQEQSLKDALAVTLEQDWSSLQDSIEQVAVQKSFLDASYERSRIAQGQYTVGLITFDNWTIIQDDLVSSKKTFLNTQANALLAEANWVAAQGRTLEYEN